MDEEPVCVFIHRPVELLWPSQVAAAGVRLRNAAAGLYMSSTLSHFLPVCNEWSFLSGPVFIAYNKKTKQNFSTVLKLPKNKTNISVHSVFLFLYADEYKSKVVCEEERMRLSCKRGMQIAVYSAMFGRTQQGTLECPLHHRRAPSVGEAPSGFQREPGLLRCRFTRC